MSTRTHSQRLLRPALFAGLALVVSSWVGSASSAERSDGSGMESFRVIVHPNNPIHATTREFVADAFFKRVTRWQHGAVIHPVDLSPDSRIRRDFSDAVLERSIAAVRSFWQQRIFSGRDLPPPELDSDEAVIKYVAGSPGAIGYVSLRANIAGVRVLALR
ncbi:MAG TPA: hypothetical protein VJR89_23215 [Polyangiales bacterium]|nr:hypothetical protein [Polyangiales bacterium]